MTTKFLLISAEDGHYWHQILKEAVAPIGTVSIAYEHSLAAEALQPDYALVIVDATVVKDISTVLYELRRNCPKANIVVATATPTWTRAREAFHAGAIDYIRKSQNKDEILTDLQVILAKAQPTAPASESTKEEPK